MWNRSGRIVKLSWFEDEGWESEGQKLQEYLILQYNAIINNSWKNRIFSSLHFLISWKNLIEYEEKNSTKICQQDNLQKTEHAFSQGHSELQEKYPSN